MEAEAQIFPEFPKAVYQLKELPSLLDLSKVTNSIISDSIQHKIEADECLGVTLSPQIKVYHYKRNQISQKWEIYCELWESKMGFHYFMKVLKNSKHPQSSSEKQKTPQQIAIQAFAHEGCQLSADLLVSDIFGPDSASIGLPPNLIAATMGKLSSRSIQEFKLTEIYRSQIFAVISVATQLAALHSKIHKIQTIVLVGEHFNSAAVNGMMQALIKYFNPDASFCFSA